MSYKLTYTGQQVQDYLTKVATGQVDGTGPVGPTGATGKEGLSIYLYDGALNDTLTTAYVAQIHVPTGYTVKTGDILFSTLETSYGAMSLVTSDAVDYSTVVGIDYIGKLAGASGGSKVIRDIGCSVASTSLGTLFVSTGTASTTNNAPYISARMRGEVVYTDNTHDTINFDIDLPIKAGDGITIEAQPLEGGTRNQQLVISASGGGGGGVSDVQVNGASIVADGVANIPYASDTKAGLVSTEAQAFSGMKDITLSSANFKHTASDDTSIMSMRTYSANEVSLYGNASASDVVFSLRQQKSTYKTSYIKNALTASNASIDIFSTERSDGIASLSVNGTNKAHIDISTRGSNASAPYLYVQQKKYLFNGESGTLLSAPSTWSTGTSGSVTLPGAGLYEVKVTKTFGEYDTDIVGFINFAKDGTKGALSTSMTYVGTAGLVSTMIIADPTGVLTFLDPATSEGDTSITISYRKIGIA